MAEEVNQQNVQNQDEPTYEQIREEMHRQAFDEPSELLKGGYTEDISVEEPEPEQQPSGGEEQTGQTQQPEPEPQPQKRRISFNGTDYDLDDAGLEQLARRGLEYSTMQSRLMPYANIIAAIEADPKLGEAIANTIRAYRSGVPLAQPQPDARAQDPNKEPEIGENEDYDAYEKRLAAWREARNQRLIDEKVAAHIRGLQERSRQAQIAEANHLVETAESLFKPFGRRDVIPRRQRMSRVDTDTDARLVVHPVDDVGQLLECVAQVRPLPCRVFQHRADPRRTLQRPVDRLGDARQAILLAQLVQVAARMEIQPVEPQLLATLHFVQKGGTRFLQPLRFGMPQIDQVAVVRQDMRRLVAKLLATGFEQLDAFRRQRRRTPLPLVAGEKGECLCADGMRVEGSVFHASRCRYMCSDEFHTASLVCKQKADKDTKFSRRCQEFSATFFRFFLLPLLPSRTRVVVVREKNERSEFFFSFLFLFSFYFYSVYLSMRFLYLNTRFWEFNMLFWEFLLLFFYKIPPESLTIAFSHSLTFINKENKIFITHLLLFSIIPNKKEHSFNPQ